ncbi:non-ribosomal peptide synthetase [Streptomyces peucetius]|uniref:Non-ribosomal peptide synthetase n=1 Tax=Streptomyces peucetius TaxID=1950 RepID=A0ABY6I1S2_STRPE|nr:non-ribosomal peptide synthetase [Streptomyces peucetius]UYQ60927.1 non-ribosomal peptide synthetase [Streptomyces peucetius]
MIAKSAPATVPQWLQQRAELAPDHLAVMVADTRAVTARLTYRQLWEAAGEVAGRLSALPGFRSGALVATRFPRGAGGLVAQLGAWRAGTAYLPLDLALPEARHRAILGDARPFAVLSPGGTAPAAIAVEPSAAGPQEPEALDPDAAYVIYTSGSTGTPKGIEVGHASLANLTAWHRETYGTGPEHRVGAFAGLGFDATVWETWSALASGATLLLPEGVATADIHNVCEFLDRWAVDQCFLSTPLAEQLLQLPQPPRSLRVLTTGGDKLRVHPRPDFPAAVFNHYGPTEATVVTTASGDLRRPARHGAPVIGRPIRGAEVLLVSDDGSTVEESSVPGELLIGGEVLAIGYLRDEPMTRKLFSHRPDGSRWYSSGDLCRWTPDGELEFVGRRDLQVSIRGHRVEPAEVEQAVLGVPGVGMAAVVARETDDGGELVGCYCGTAEAETVRDELARSLPGYMVPVELRRLDGIPLNANGKIDRGRLLELVGPGAPSNPGSGTTDRTGAEAGAGASTAERVTGIWSEVLGRTPAADDDFFLIGGHSLKAARVLAMTRKEFGIPLALEVMFTRSVFSDFVECVAEQLRIKEG